MHQQKELSSLLKGFSTAQVIGEDRTIKIKDGKFEDDFKAYDVHIYRIE
jgi:hypothetical protein